MQAAQTYTVNCFEKNIGPHTHTWPTEGKLTIERCEKVCAFCNSTFGSGWFVRRHVKDTHAKRDYPGLEVSEGWSTAPNGNAKPNSHESMMNRRSNKHKKRSQAIKQQVLKEETTPAPTTATAPCTPPSQTGRLLPDDIPAFDLNDTTGINPYIGTGNENAILLETPPTERAAKTLMNMAASNETIDPSFFNLEVVSQHISPWSTPQSARTNRETVAPEYPSFFDDGADFLVGALNAAFVMTRNKFGMGDGAMLFVGNTYMQAFAEGREF